MLKPRIWFKLGTIVGCVEILTPTKNEVQTSKPLGTQGPTCLIDTLLIANNFLSIGLCGMLLHPELHQQYFKRVADLNCETLGEKPVEKLGAHKPCQNQQPENS